GLTRFFAWVIRHEKPPQLKWTRISFRKQRKYSSGVPVRSMRRIALFQVEAESSRMNSHLDVAIEEAERGRAEGGIPIGAVLVHRGEIIGRGHNRRVQQGSAVLHGEMDALERAGRRPASIYRAST